jgi:hypothetical protein
MRARAQVGGDAGVIGVSLAPTIEASKAALAGLIGVDGDPGLALRAVAINPSAFAD